MNLGAYCITENLMERIPFIYLFILFLCQLILKKNEDILFVTILKRCPCSEFF